jgi:transcriptional regulator with XRE-family HTH domain
LLIVKKRCKLLISIAQLRAARGLLGWSKAKLAEEVGLPVESIKHYESTNGVDMPEEAGKAMCHVLETAGIEFLNGGQPGVRMKATAATVPVDQLNASNDE